MLKLLETAEAVRSTLKATIDNEDWLIVAGPKNSAMVATLAAIASNFDFEVCCGKIATAARTGDPFVLVCFAAVPAEAFTDRQITGFIRARLPEFPIETKLARTLAIAGNDTEARELAALLASAAQGKLLTPAERIARN